MGGGTSGPQGRWVVGLVDRKSMGGGNSGPGCQ